MLELFTIGVTDGGINEWNGIEALILILKSESELSLRIFDERFNGRLVVMIGMSHYYLMMYW